MKVIGDRLRGVEISTKELAEKLKCTRQAISLIKTGKANPSVEKLVEIAKTCQVSSDYLLGLSDVPTTDTTIQAICNRTGLSDDFVSWLSSHKDYAPQIEKLSKLMIENGFIGGDNSEQE